MGSRLPRIVALTPFFAAQYPLAALIRLGIALALVLRFAVAHAEVPPEFVDRPPAQLANDAFDAEYGRLLVAEFGKILRASADAGCLRSKGLDPAALDGLGRELLVRNGMRMLEIYSGVIDARKFETAFTARAGKNGKADLARLRKDPDVRKLNELAEPAVLARLADNITETIDRHILLAGLRLSKPISPIATGDYALMQANPEERSLEAAEQFFESHPSPRLKRWRELEEATLEAVEHALNREEFLNMGPRHLTPDAMADFANLCVFPAPRKPTPAK